MRNNIRAIAMALVIMLSLPAVVSCSGGNVSPVTTPDDVQTSETTVAPVTTDETTTEVQELPVMPEKAEYDGYEFIILLTGNFKNNDYGIVEGASDVMSEAIFRNNSAIEEKLGITLSTVDLCSFNSTTGGGPGYTKLTAAYHTQSYDYDIGLIGTYDVCALAQGGYLRELTSLPYLDLERSWWSQKANDQLSIANVMFYTTGDISTTDNRMTHCIMFNKDIMKSEKDLLNPYTLVQENHWTYDVFGEEVKKVGEDVDGNQVMDSYDKYGLLTWNDAALAALNSAYQQICRLDDNGDMILSLTDEKAYDIINKYAEIALSDHTHNYQTGTTQATWDPDRIRMFDDGLAYFYMTTFNTVPKHRDSETDFGILPYPKANESQEFYGHLVSAYHANFFCVPAFVEDEERTGAISQYIAYSSQQNITPAYYVKTLVGQYIRDEESSVMLDIIFADPLYDIGSYYKIGNYNDTIMQSVSRGEMSSFVSSVERMKRAADKQIERINTNLKKVAESIGK